jgi:hypothetical protein
MTSNLTKFILLGVASTAMATLVGCGGGNSASVYGLTGVAAKGLAIKQAAVTVSCLSGSATSTTNDTGFYGVAITNGVGPCLVKVTKGAESYYSITPPGSTGSAIANVNQISNAIVNALVLTKGSGTVDNLVTAAFAPKAADLDKAVTSTLAVINALLPVAQQLPSTTNLLGDPAIKAATFTGASDGSALDKALDFFAVKDATSLPASLITSINSAVALVVTPNATGSTGSSGNP